MNELEAATEKKSLITKMASQYNLTPQVFTDVIRKTVIPSGATNEQMAAFLLVADTYGLNPVTKEIYAFPAKSGGIQPMVGIDGWVHLIQRRPELDGFDFRYHYDDAHAVVSCTCTMYRKDRTRPIVVTEFMDECKRNTAPWQSHPVRMLRHKALIQAARYSFGFSGIRDEDEAFEVIERDVTPAVDDLNAELSKETAVEAMQKPVEAPAEEPATETPECDAEGVQWDPELHAQSKARNADGTWRKRRQAKKEPPTEMPFEMEPTPAHVDPMTFAAIADQLQRAASVDDVDLVYDLIRDFPGPEDQRSELMEKADDMRARIAELAQ